MVGDDPLFKINVGLLKASANLFSTMAKVFFVFFVILLLAATFAYSMPDMWLTTFFFGVVASISFIVFLIYISVSISLNHVIEALEDWDEDEGED